MVITKPLLGFHRHKPSSHTLILGCITICTIFTAAVVGYHHFMKARVVLAGIVTDLPNGWVEALDNNNKTYYYNENLGLSSWNPPNLPAASQAPVKPAHETPQVASKISKKPNTLTKSLKPAAKPQKFIHPAATTIVSNTGRLSEAKTSNLQAPIKVNVASLSSTAIQNAPKQVVTNTPNNVIFSNTQQTATSNNPSNVYPVRNTDSTLDDDNFDDEDFAHSLDDQYNPPTPSPQSMARGVTSDDMIDLGGPIPAWSTAQDGPPVSLLKNAVSKGSTILDSGASLQQPAVRPTPSLASTAPKTEDGADISSPPDWPTELPGAEGGGPSWIVGMHREPHWSDSQQGCSPFSYCDKGTADRGHRFQRTADPYLDKRRTFDPYAQATEQGRKAYPWDPTKDPQVYGTGDCSDGVLRDDCWKEPDAATLAGKQDALRRRLDEFYPDNIREGYRESAQAAAGGAGAAKRYTEGDTELRAGGGPRYVGGRPVGDSLGTILRKVDGSARQRPIVRDLQRDASHFWRDLGRLVTSVFAAPRVELLSAPAPPAALTKGTSIWESPIMVAAKGLFGIKDAAAAAAAHKSVGRLPRVGARDPLRPLSDDVERVAEGGGSGRRAAAAAAAARSGGLKGWQEATIQQGTLRRESTRDNLVRAVRRHDAVLLRRKTGFTNQQLRSLEADAAALAKSSASSTATAVAAASHAASPSTHGTSAAAAAGGAAAAGLPKWQQAAVKQAEAAGKGVAAGLRAALSARELRLLEQKSGWHSRADLDKAEAFAENLERAISARRRDEQHHPLVPAAAASALRREAADHAPAPAVASSPPSGAAAAGAQAAANEKTKVDKATARARVEEAKAKAAEAVAGESAKRSREEMVKWELVHGKEVRRAQQIREEEPVVRAYEAQVRNDEKEFAEEVKQQADTLTQLRKDQADLLAAVRKQSQPERAGAGAAPRHGLKRGGAGGAGGARDDGPLHDAAVAAGTGKYSAQAAEKDIDAYFASLSPAAAAPAKRA